MVYLNDILTTALLATAAVYENTAAQHLERERQDFATTDTLRALALRVLASDVNATNMLAGRLHLAHTATPAPNLLRDAPDEALIGALRSKGLAVVVFGPEDFKSPRDLRLMRDDLQDIMAERGNTYISDMGAAPDDDDEDEGVKVCIWFSEARPLYAEGWFYDQAEDSGGFDRLTPTGPFASKAEAQDAASKVFDACTFFDGLPDHYEEDRDDYGREPRREY